MEKIRLRWMSQILKNMIKGDHVNTGGIQMWNKQDGEWYDWKIGADIKTQVLGGI